MKISQYHLIKIKSALGEDGIANVAEKMGVDADGAASKLTDVLPALLDKASSGGDLMGQFTGGGAGGLLGMVKKFLGK